MIRIGKKPIIIEKEVKVTKNNGKIQLTGPAGKLDFSIPDVLAVEISENTLKVVAKNGQSTKSIQGLFRSLLQNAVTGVRSGWSKTLELVGVGFRAQTDGRELTLNLGFSHLVKITAPEGISFKVVENKIVVFGPDRYLVGEIAAKIRRLKPPEPYKGKGIRYEGEYIRKKLGKAAKAVGAAGAK